MLLRQFCFRKFFIPPDSAFKTEHSIKTAGAKKINLMHKHAMKLHSGFQKGGVIKTYFGHALSQFSNSQDKIETTGGMVWSYKEIVNLLFSNRNDDGILISAKIKASILSQILISFVLLIIGAWLTQYAYRSWITVDEVTTQVADAIANFLTNLTYFDIVHNATVEGVATVVDFTSDFLENLEEADVLRFDCLAIGSSLVNTCSRGVTSGLTDIACSIFASNGDYLCSTLEPLLRPFDILPEERLNAASGIFNLTVLHDPIYSVINQAAYDNIIVVTRKWYPEERYMVWIPCLIATIVAFASSIRMSMVVLPNCYAIIHKWRSGVLPSLTDAGTFTRYRWLTVNISNIGGVMFW